MPYEHRDKQGKKINLPVGKVVCVGRNYAAHAKELGNDIPETPLLFMKPTSALCHFENEIQIPKNKGSVHFETEIAVLLQSTLKDANEDKVMDAIWGFGLALDLTLRDVQNELKSKGQPWEKAKAFDGACPVTAFIGKNEALLEKLSASSFLNGKQAQFINPENMLWPISSLIAFMSECFTLHAGDIILTGTPEGVGELNQGDCFLLNMYQSGKEILTSKANIQ